MQQETGAEIIVDDDGVVGTVAIAGTDRDAVYEAERQINLILDPPTADVGETYAGKVVNITNFGAFVNILPGRDGLLHISKIGGNKRINKVEDVLELGQEVEVRVEDIDPNGKISLVPVDDGSSKGNVDDENDHDEKIPEKTEGKNESTNDDAKSFEDEFEEGLVADLGDLGPQAVGRLSLIHI